MLSRLRRGDLERWRTLATLLPLSVWALLWLSLSPGSLDSALHPGNLRDFAEGIRAVFPFAAAYIAAMIVVFKLVRHRPPGFRFLGPLGLATLYGLVGLFATWNSPDGEVALRWAALYLSVPLVLWAIVWGTDPLGRICLMINATWLVIILATITLFFTALFYLDLKDVLQDPSRFLDCKSANWYDLTTGRLRDTGVGRYAAIAGIVAISGLWRRNWRLVWGVVLAISVVLLLFSGARGAMGGFAVGTVMTLALYGGRRALFAGVLALAVLIPVFWATGAHDTFLGNCVIRNLPSQSLEQQYSVAAEQQGTSVQAPVATNPPQGGETTENRGEDPVQLGTLGGEASAAGGQDGQGTESEGESTSNKAENVAVIQSQEAIQDQAGSLESDSSGGTRDGEGPQLVRDGARESTAEGQPSLQPASDSPVQRKEEFFEFTGRSAVWADALRLFKESPIIGYGFHADRIMLGTHAHNAFVQSMVQTGLIGTIPFLGALLFAWVLLFRNARRLMQLPETHKHLVIQCGAVLGFLTIRSFPESTGAFFGVDWLILAPLLLYLHLVHSSYGPSNPAPGG